MFCTEPLLLEIEVSGEAVRISNASDFNRKLREIKKGTKDFHIYVIFSEDTVLYVGECKDASKSITNRRARRGYVGYKWLDHKYLGNKIWCKVFHFENPDEKVECGIEKGPYADPFKRYREAIEAEMVFYLRTRYGKWPVCQNEIHFYESLRGDKDVEKCVRYISNELEGFIKG